MPSPQEVVDEVKIPQTEFGLTNGVVKFLTEDGGLAAQNMSDTVYMIAEERETKVVIDNAGVQNELQQTACLKHAWVKLVKNKKTEGLSKQRGNDEMDLDDMLKMLQLDTIAKQFWARSKSASHHQIDPSNALVSRLAKELDRGC